MVPTSPSTRERAPARSPKIEWIYAPLAGFIPGAPRSGCLGLRGLHGCPGLALLGERGWGYAGKGAWKTHLVIHFKQLRQYYFNNKYS